MEVLLLSTSKFSSSAAYSALPAAAVLLPRGAVNCTFRDFLARCGISGCFTTIAVGFNLETTI